MRKADVSPEKWAEHTECERARYWAKRGLPLPAVKRDIHSSAYGKWMRAFGKSAAERASEVPVPLFPQGHDLYDDARRVLLRSELSELDCDMDSGARDVLQTYVLARLEGCDPVAAVRQFRARLERDRKVLVRGLALVDGLER